MAILISDIVNFKAKKITREGTSYSNECVPNKSHKIGKEKNHKKEIEIFTTVVGIFKFLSTIDRTNQKINRNV